MRNVGQLLNKAPQVTTAAHVQNIANVAITFPFKSALVPLLRILVACTRMTKNVAWHSSPLVSVGTILLQS